MLQAAPKNVHIYLESNPNPNSLKFVVNEMLVPEGLSFDFPDTASAAEVSPLAKELFDFPFVDRVFFASNFITISKKEDVEWLEVQSTLKEYIKKYLEAGKFIIELGEPETPAEEETDTIRKIKTILDEYIRPAVEQDGGAITYHSFNDGVVKVKLQGSCSGCPSSMITLKAGIENLFTRMMPGEIKSVEALA
jgi:Fe-S cluster biogenesis protein NfuA